MQTFLPYQSFSESAKCLDRQRLGKQRVEAWQILQAITDPNYGWQNHPAVKMWRGYEFELCAYGFFICEEWINRGYKDSLRDRFLEYQEKHPCPLTDLKLIPRWLGNKNFHASHRSALLFKNYDWYSQFGWTEEPKYDYVWPVK